MIFTFYIIFSLIVEYLANISIQKHQETIYTLVLFLCDIYCSNLSTLFLFRQLIQMINFMDIFKILINNSNKL